MKTLGTTEFDEASFQANPIIFISPDKYAELVLYISTAQPSSRVFRVMKTAISFFGLPLAYHCERIYKNMTLAYKVMHAKVLKEIEKEILKRTDESAYSAADLSFFHVKETYSNEYQEPIEFEKRVCCTSAFRSDILLAFQPNDQLYYLHDFPSVPKDLAKLVCSFLNSNGGIIIIGAEEVAYDNEIKWRPKPLAKINPYETDPTRFSVSKALFMLNNSELVHQRVRHELVPVTNRKSDNSAYHKGYVVRLLVESDPCQRVFSVDKELYVRIENRSERLSNREFYEYRMDRLAYIKRQEKEAIKPTSSVHFHKFAAGYEEEAETNEVRDNCFAQRYTNKPAAAENDSIIEQIRHLLSITSSDTSTKPDRPSFAKLQEQTVKEKSQNTRRLMFQDHRKKTIMNKQEEGKDN